MKVIIAGPRNCYDVQALDRAIAESGFEITEVVSGCATGVDHLGEMWARSRWIPIKEFPADWKRLGRKAGPIRNRQMALYADAAVFLWDGQSRGTKNCIQEVEGLGKPSYVYRIGKHE